MVPRENNNNAYAQFGETGLGCRDSTVVRALASHQCGPGLIPRSGVKCGLSLLVLYSALRGFLRELRFPLSSKTKQKTNKKQTKNIMVFSKMAY